MNWIKNLFSRATQPADGQAAIGEPEADQTRRGWIKRLGLMLGGGLVAGPALAAVPRGMTFRTTGADPYMGEIMIFAGNFAPQGFAFCHGQILPISQNTALFAILGTTYGGNGQTTFALPDLRGRFPIQQGQGPGLSSYSLGQQAGQETVTLLTSELPAHTHSLNVNSGAGTSQTPVGNVLAMGAGTNVNNESIPVMGYAAGPNGAANSGAIGTTGGNQPTPNMPPYLALNFCICIDGIFPPR